MQEPFKETNANKADISSYLTRCVVDLVLSESMWTLLVKTRNTVIISNLMLPPNGWFPCSADEVV